jgi:hypothetical protein
MENKKTISKVPEHTEEKIPKTRQEGLGWEPAEGIAPPPPNPVPQPAATAPAVYLYVAKETAGNVTFQIGGHDLEILGLIEFATFFMRKKMEEQLKFETAIKPKAVQ